MIWFDQIRKIPKSRYHSVVFGVMLSIGARGVGAISGLISIPLLLNHFGKSDYGVWVFVLSISGMLSFMDFGIGNALLNRSAKTHGPDALSDNRRLIATALICFGILAVILASFVFAASARFKFSSILNLEGSDLDSALLVYFLYVIGSIPLAAIQRLQIGLGKGWINPATNIALSISGLLVIIISCSASLSLRPTILFYAAIQWVISLVSVVIFLWKANLMPSLFDFQFKLALSLIREGVPFFALQLAAILGSQIDNLLIVRYLGVDSLTTWSISIKFFQLLALVPSLVNTYLWPLYTGANSRSEFGFIWKTLSVTIAGSLMYFTLFGLVVIFLFPLIISMWLSRSDIMYSVPMLIGVLVYTAVEAMGSSCGTVLNALSKMKPQLVLSALNGVCAPLAKASCLYWLGLELLPWATAGVYCAIHFPIYYVVLRGVKMHNALHLASLNRSLEIDLK